MPDKRSHRGPHPEDGALFGPDAQGKLRRALVDYAELLTRGYAAASALKLVGDHFALRRRQRLALLRSACSDAQCQKRQAHRCELAEITGQVVAIDGYNLLITLEAALSGAIIFKGRDGCCRDLAGLHGTYRKVEETPVALQLVGDFLKELNVFQVQWVLDRPVSNSGRLKTLMEKLSQAHHWPWDIELSLNPDAVLKTSGAMVVTSDSVILDYCPRWINLAAEIIHTEIPSARVFCLGTDGMDSHM